MPVRKRSISRRELTDSQKLALLGGGRGWRRAFGSIKEATATIAAHPEEAMRLGRKCPTCAGIILRDASEVHCMGTCGTMPVSQYLER